MADIETGRDQHGLMSSEQMGGPSQQTGLTREGAFDLACFFPYQVRVFYQAVSTSVSEVYSEAYELSVAEWRVMAVLGPHQSMSANEITNRSSMNKVNVSRAVSRLRKRGFLKQDIDGDDRRRSVLHLTDAGKEAFANLVPQVRQVEAQLLEGLDSQEIETLTQLMNKVRANAEKKGPIPKTSD